MSTRDALHGVERTGTDLQPAPFWRVRATELCSTGLWDIERVEFAADGTTVVGHIASGSAGPGYEPHRAFALDTGWWGGRPSPDDGRCFLGVEFERAVVPSAIMLRHAPGAHRARCVTVESSDDGVRWNECCALDVDPDRPEHLVFYDPATVRAAPAWRLATRNTSCGFAWDVRRVRFLRRGADIAGTIAASGAAGDGFGIERAGSDNDSFWGGRADEEGRFHITVTSDSDLELDRIVLDQGSDHWARSVVLERRTGDGAWRAWRHFADLRPGLNDLLVYPPRRAAEPAAGPTRRTTRRFGRFDDRRILVTIASYRDVELATTIESALAQAAYPEHVRFAICHQFDDRTRDLLTRWADDPRFSFDEVDHGESRGCCWARHRTFQLYDDEPYVLQIDAHMRFAARWDVRYIDMLESIDAPLPILTSYPPSYTIDDDAAVQYDLTAGVQALYIDEVRDDLTTLQRTSPPADLNHPGPSPALAAGQLFTRGRFCRDVDYDPEMYFAGEEISLAARAFTSGYDLYYPTENLVWHLYDHDHPKHWQDHDDHHDTHAAALARLRTLFQGDAASLGKYGLGSTRTLAEFEDHAGVDLGARRVGADRSVTIDIDRSVIEPRDDYLAFVAVFLDRDGREVSRHELRAPDVLDLSRGTVTIQDVAKDASAFILLAVTQRGRIGEVALQRVPTRGTERRS